MEEAKKRKIKLKHLDEYANRIELIQDFEFPISSQRVKVTEDQNYIIATGIYAPSVKIFDTQELTLKCERGLDAEVVQLQVLSSDYSKLAFLCADRNIELHAQYGRHFKIRIPKFGRDMIYQPYSCDLLTVGATNEIYRLNLDLGRFNSPFVSDNEELTCIDYSHDLNLIAVGGINGNVEFWNMDQRSKVIDLKPQKSEEEISSLAFEPNSLNIAVGTNNGKVMLYDMRYPLPMLTLTHHYKLPINAIKFHEASRKIITSDRKIVKVYDKNDGRLFTNIEPKSSINDIELCGKNTGLIFAPQEQNKIGTYFIPSLGHAPKWAAFLENLTEEMEESKATTLYEDYKFLTANDLEQLNATHLIGTPMLKAYMHGYFLEMRAYQKLLSINDPFAYDKYKKEQINKKLNALREKRINLPTKKAKVNKDFLQELMNQQEGVKGKKVDVDALINDDRFGKMFTDADFVRDKASDAYRLIKPQDKRKRDDDVDSIEGEEDERDTKGTEVNKIFGGQADSEEEENNEKDFEQRLSKKERKEYKKQNKDKILIGKGLFNSKQGQFQEKKQDKSKQIKKGGRFGQKNVITDQQVKQKLKQRRMVVPTHKLK